MKDKEKLNNPKHLQEVISKMLGEAGGDNLITPGASENPIEQMQQFSSHLEQGMIELYQNLSTLGQVLDVSRLHNFMIAKILVDKGIVTEEEIQKRYKTEVEDELKKQQELMRIKLEEQMNEAVKTQSEKEEK